MQIAFAEASGNPWTLEPELDSRQLLDMLHSAATCFHTQVQHISLNAAFAGVLRCSADARRAAT